MVNTTAFLTSRYVPLLLLRKRNRVKPKKMPMKHFASALKKCELKVLLDASMRLILLFGLRALNLTTLNNGV